MNKLLSIVLLIVFISCSKSDDGGTDYSSNSNTSLSNNSNSSSSSDPVALTELPSGTFVFSVTAQNSNNYRVSVTDSNETQFGFDPTLKLNAGDDIVFNVNSPGHPFFLKTSTGYAEKGATIEAVQLFKTHLPSNVQIKASGGIRDYAFASALVAAGATRLGCSASVAIVTGAPATGNY